MNCNANANFSIPNKLSYTGSSITSINSYSIGQVFYVSWNNMLDANQHFLYSVLGVTMVILPADDSVHPAAQKVNTI